MNFEETIINFLQLTFVYLFQRGIEERVHFKLEMF